MLTSRTIAVFLTLGETLSYTETARRLYLTHQAVSKQIARLEEELGHGLFVRSTRSVQLTAVGEVYLSYFREEARRFEAASQEAEEVARSQENDLRVGFPLGIQPPEWLTELLRQKQRQWGEGKVRLEWHDVDELLRRFAGGSLDVVLCPDDSGLAEQPGLCRQEVARVRLVAAVSTHHPCWRGGGLEQLRGQTFVYQRESTRASTYEMGRFVAQAVEQAGVKEAKVELVPNLQSRHSAVELGLACCVCLDLDILCFRPDVRTYPLERPDTGLSCFWRRGEEKGIVRGFTDELSHIIQNMENPAL